ncbi:universal stress protein [Alkaliphilus transvaalensis]|uniref:universal stress protein n=1 Tax=Alkaliphilus transvaalensis TaxID=114628 RepID=UPI00047E7C59|nr:universal stress protein [Alkaliphilus transvaalensis]
MQTKGNTMVCVTQQKTCERLIKIGVELREKFGGELIVVHVAPEGFNILGNSHEGEALEYLFDISKSVDAEMTVLRSSNVEKTIVNYCKKADIERIVMGESQEVLPENSMTLRLSKKLKENITITVIPTE